MSYNFRVKSTDGVLTITEQQGNIPTGEWNVAGHADQTHETLAVGVLNSDGSVRLSATAGMVSAPVAAPSGT